MIQNFNENLSNVEKKHKINKEIVMCDVNKYEL